MEGGYFKLTAETCYPEGEVRENTIKVSHWDLDVGGFHEIAAELALAMGYSPKNVSEIFYGDRNESECVEDLGI